MTAMTPPPRAALPVPLEEPRFSVLLLQITDAAPHPRIAIGELIDGFGRRGHGALLIVLGAPNILPLPLPGLSMISGLPLLLLALQLALGYPAPWFPEALRRRSFDRTEFRRIAMAIAPRLLRLERVIRPRWPSLTTGLWRQALGLLAVILAVALMLPLPLGNALPGLALALIGLAVLEGDSGAGLAGIVVGAIGLAVTAFASAALAGGAWLALRGLLG
ncbi:exopolysaccharide biosynthesis protein [Aquicoccus sp. SCR17]|nr:exopolysaccharide biosynthesis protein [Carideicomes alvinocaridis]